MEKRKTLWDGKIESGKEIREKQQCLWPSVRKTQNDRWKAWSPSEKRRRFGSTIVLRNKIGLPYGYQVCIQCSFDCLGAFLTTLNLTLDWVLPSLIHYCSRHAVILAWLVLLRMHFPFYSISSLPWGLCNLNFEMMLEACSPVHSSPQTSFPLTKPATSRETGIRVMCVEAILRMQPWTLIRQSWVDLIRQATLPEATDSTGRWQWAFRLSRVDWGQANNRSWV